VESRENCKRPDYKDEESRCKVSLMFLVSCSLSDPKECFVVS
jgi:hypothetical protein